MELLLCSSIIVVAWPGFVFLTATAVFCLAGENGEFVRWNCEGNDGEFCSSKFMTTVHKEEQKSNPDYDPATTVIAILNFYSDKTPVDGRY